MHDPELSPGLRPSGPISDGNGGQFAAAGLGTVREPAFGSVTVAELTSDPAWTLVEDGFTLAREHEVESLFAISNGYVGNRGSLAEGSPLSYPASFVAGVFELDARPPLVPGFLLLPDWTGIRAWIEDHQLCMDQGQVLAHRRILDMRHGTLWREWRHRDVNGRITNIVAFRLASLADRHVLVQSVTVTPENYSGRIRLETSIELTESARSSAMPEQWKTRRSAIRPNVLPLALRSHARDITVAFGAASHVTSQDRDTGLREIEITDRRITERYLLNVGMGAEYRLDRLVSIYSSRDTSDPTEAAITHVNELLARGGVAPAVKAHRDAWHSRWKAADIEVENDQILQKALRFAEYHLISAANPEDERVSVGARALTGEAYKGHVFWDTEIYMVPFYVFTHPASARALLMYRYHTLPAAREKARVSGFGGAMYPWESADTGEETTPDHVIGPDGKVIRVLNGPMEVHITADIAYAVWQYWQASGDDDFLFAAGAEILVETARFWASRGEFEADGSYHIRHVIGPDEYHENVDDSAYTNLMARWNLRRGLDVRRLLGERWREFADRLKITKEELASWARIADAMYTGFDPATKRFEQFRGFYQKNHVDLMAYEPRHAAMDVILGHEQIQSTDVVKQADVIMAMYLLWDEFPPDVRAANFRYYEPLTGHGSSLSPSIHALVAARLGDLKLAESYLKQSAEIDLGNNMGNAAGGIHAAAIGGLWQAMVFGFAGTAIHESVSPHGDGRGAESGSAALSFDPHILPHWRRLSFPLQFRGRQLRITWAGDSIHFVLEQGEPIPIAVPGEGQTVLHPQQPHVTRRAGKTGSQTGINADEVA